MIKILSHILFSLLLIFLSAPQSCKDDNTDSLKETAKEKDSVEIPKYDDFTFKTAFKNISKAKKENDFNKLGGIYLALGSYYLKKSRYDSAFFYYNHSKEFFSLKGNRSYTGISLSAMALTQSFEGDFPGSDETATEALKYLQSPKDNRAISNVYSTLATSKFDQKDYSQALKYYKLTLQFLTDTLSRFYTKNNLAITNTKLRNFPVAINILSSLSNDPFSHEHPSLLAMVNDNLAYTRWLNNPRYNAENELYRALRLREKENDLLGQIANHYHLSEYFEEKNYGKAVFHAKRTYELATIAGSPNDQLDALRKLILLDVHSSSENTYFASYVKLNDSLQLARDRSKNQFALIRYEVGKNKEENALLKAENAQKNYQLLRHRILVFSITVLIILASFFSMLWYRARTRKFKREKEKEVQRIELKYSKKIHDEVANGIYFLMVLLENNPDAKPTKIIDKLEELYNKSRDISHDAEFKIDIKEDFSVILRNMIQLYGVKNTKIIIIGNEPQLWEPISVEKKEEIYHILKELMTNMKKHSEATIVVLKFKLENTAITIHYSDNGIGLADPDQTPDKEFKNIRSCLNLIKGKFYIDHEQKKGFSMKIIIPA
ncbi:MAG: hypothetical protein LBP34_05355 [Flavobacteriaceae bacterium]|jgi:signal transduction histidine kinase|nr:hypothetical protein [Flavobacteriaceae bacterium]